MLAFPNAKINLGLNVTGKRNDGFHDIETVFYPVSYRDSLEIVPSESVQTGFHSSGLPIPGEVEQNLCIRAYNLLAHNFKISPVNIHLQKVIPMGAGLGGGSSDAAATIRIINELFQLSLTPAAMIEYARKLGSDCAFFIENKPVFATGRGDQFTDIELTLAGYSILIVVPPVHVGTAEAYQQIIPYKPGESILSMLKLSPDEWKGRLVNDFELPVFLCYPEIRQIKETLYAEGAVYAAMSGSGSAVYGLFNGKLPDLNVFQGCITWTGVM